MKDEALVVSSFFLCGGRGVEWRVGRECSPQKFSKKIFSGRGVGWF